MRRVFWQAAVAAMALALSSCGSTGGNDDAQVIDIINFDGENIVQCDEFVGSNVEVDVQADTCDEETGEPFTDTFVNVNMQNNQKLDITINSYTVDIEDSTIGQFGFSVTDTVTGKRCSNVATLACAVNSDCFVVGGGLGTCQPSQTSIQLRLFDIDDKIRIVPDVVPFGRTLNVNIKLFGSDISGENWTASGTITARFGNFDNCQACTLGQ